jgi:hypothetical protein
MAKVIVDPGICGFPCEVEVKRQDGMRMTVGLTSQCVQVSKLGEAIGVLELKDIFSSPASNTVYKFSEAAGCHASCPVPLAILKCAEVEMGVALPKDVGMRFCI